MRTLDLYSCDNKGADQLHSICTADQRLCFHYSASTIPYFFNLIFLYAVAWLGCTLHVTWLCYIPNTYSIHKVSSLKFAYFQGKLSRYMIKMYRYEFFTAFDLISALVQNIAHPDRFRKTCAARLAHSSTGVWISYIKFTR